MSFFRKKEVPLTPPPHIAVIMDGNGRWAQRRGLPRSAGHRAGAENFRRLATYLRDIGVQYMTVFAFSTENWRRPAEEVAAIWNILREYLAESLERMERDRVKVRVIGRRGNMPHDVMDLLHKIDEKSKTIDGITLCICLDYGAREELLQAARRIAAECVEGALDPEELVEDDISNRLYSSGIPDPDLVIRPSGELRLSNFLLWQSAYSEFYFTKKLFPDFGVREMEDAIRDYMTRDRRFGARSKGVVR